MLTIPEFNAAADSYLWREVPLSVVVGLTYLVGAAVAGFIAFKLVVPFGPAAPPLAQQAVGVGVSFVFCYGWRFLVSRAARPIKRRIRRGYPQLDCPHCSEWLAGSRSHVVATHYCQACGEQAIADPEPAADTPPLLSPSELEAAEAAAAVQERKVKWFSIAVVLGPVALASVPVGMLLLGAALGQPLLVAIGLIGLLLLGPAWGACFFWGTISLIRSTPRVVCPWCATRWSARWCREVGICGRCGRGMLAEPVQATYPC